MSDSEMSREFIWMSQGRSIPVLEAPYVQCMQLNHISTPMFSPFQLQTTYQCYCPLKAVFWQS